MIRLRKPAAIKILAILLAVSLSQLCVQIGMAQARLISGRLTTTGGRPIMVNGASMASGGTIMTGMTLETPDQVGASIDLGPLGVVDLEPNSTIEIAFADDGTIRVKLIRGCAKVNKKGDGTGEIYTAEGASEKTNDNRKGLGFCFVNGALNPFPQATTAAAGGSNTALWWVIGLTIAGTVGGVAWGLRGGNDSP